jgi:hypothetical protein
MAAAAAHLRDHGIFVMCQTSRKEAAERIIAFAPLVRLAIAERWDFIPKVGKPSRYAAWVRARAHAHTP